MKTIKGLSALMLAAAFMISTAAIAGPGKAVVKQQSQTEKKAPVKTEKKMEKKAPKKAKKDKKAVKKTSAKKAPKTTAPAAK